MFKKFLLGIFLLTISILLFTQDARAQNQQQFSTSYNVTYDVDDTGLTTVTEQVDLKNLTDQYYASSFQLTIGATKLNNIQAFDTGPLETSSQVEGTKTKITVNFNAQVAGKGKEQKFTIQFSSSDFAQKQGKIWQVSIPKISSSSEVDSYDLTLSVPVDFGDPASIQPSPSSKSESDGKILLNFTKDQLINTGILASFGANQLFSYNLYYTLNNSSILPTIAKLPLPPDTNYQQVEVDSISPKPDNVSLDQDGNYIAYFKVTQRSSLSVDVAGLAKLYISPRGQPDILSTQQKQDLTSSQRYWDKDNPVVASKLSDIFKNTTPKTNRGKAQLINDFVVNYLSYDSSRLAKGDFTRLGGLTALNNPNNALCSEFTDLFITLARAAGVPAREMDGYTYSSNTDLRPLSFGSTLLHDWPEYYDDTLGWVMVDPTWQNTTGGVDYFSQFDLNHLVLDVRGYSSTDPTTASQVKVNFTNATFNPHPNLNLSIDSPSEIYSGFPATFKIDVENSGSSLLNSSLLTLIASKVIIAGSHSYYTPKLPPFGHALYSFDLRTPGLFQQFQDTLIASVGNQSISRQVLVKPFFSYKYFPEIVLTLVGIMVIIYLSVLSTYIYKVRRKHTKK